LSERSFGGNRYSFRRTEVDRYKRLVQIIRKFNLLDEEAGKELRDFFEDHREEILDSDREMVPDVLDYRNWFRYDMKVMAVNHKEVLMDRRTKSVGSGGEQAVPNYLLILTVAHFLYAGNELKIQALVFDEAFYGIDSERRNQLLGFATDLGLQLFVASPDQDGVKEELAHSTTLFVIKDKDFNVHLRPFHYVNPDRVNQELLAEFAKPVTSMVTFGAEL
jgi:hypothetical protein